MIPLVECLSRSLAIFGSTRMARVARAGAVLESAVPPTEARAVALMACGPSRCQGSALDDLPKQIVITAAGEAVLWPDPGVVATVQATGRREVRQWLPRPPAHEAGATICKRLR